MAAVGPNAGAALAPALAKSRSAVEKRGKREKDETRDARRRGVHEAASSKSVDARRGIIRAQ